MSTGTLGVVIPLACILLVGVLKQASLIDGGVADTALSFLLGGGAGAAIGGAFINTPKS